MSKLILGTAQFGSNYGIKKDGQPSIPETEKIARIAWDAGIRVIHTSWQYPFDGIEYFYKFNKIEKDAGDPDYYWWDRGMGISIYGPESEEYLDGFDSIQFPLNILDTRCLRLKKKVPFIARSVFLQGLLLMDELPRWISDSASESIGLFQAMARLSDLEYYEAALGWVLGLDEIDHVIVGVNSAEQLEQLVKVKPLKWDYDFSIHDEMVLDPRRWPKG